VRAAWPALLLLLAACSAPPAPDTPRGASRSEAKAEAHSEDPAQARRSGFADMSAATQAMQRDDAANPAWLWVEEGRQHFAATCARCHRIDTLAGVAARYPAWDAVAARPFTLGQRIAACHARGSGGDGDAGAKAPTSADPHRNPLPPDSDTRIALEAFVSLQSRGRPIAPPADPRLVPWRDRGRALFQQRLGQLDLSCAQCHDQHAGQRLAGSLIPQGHATGYPIYRLEWQGMGTLQRRLRGCLNGVRAEPFGWDSDEMTALEVYLAARAAGMPMEAPAVRP